MRNVGAIEFNGGEYYYIEDSDCFPEIGEIIKFDTIKQLCCDGKRVYTECTTRKGKAQVVSISIEEVVELHIIPDQPITSEEMKELYG